LAFIALLRCIHGRMRDSFVRWMRQKNDSNAADMAAAPMAITAAREKVVNFVRPFMHVGLTLVVRKPAVAINIPYSFGIFQPLDPAVWGLIVLALTVVSNCRQLEMRVSCNLVNVCVRETCKPLLSVHTNAADKNNGQDNNIVVAARSRL